MADTTVSYKAKLRDLPVLQSPWTEQSMGELPADPYSAFKAWLDAAIAAGVSEPHAMVLSTVDASGCPDARVLILKNIDHRGWHFAIKADSPKGRQVLGSGQAALTFYWPELARQVRLRGPAVPLPDDECKADFAARPVKAQAGALASKQSEILPSRDALLRRVVDAERVLKHAAAADDDSHMPHWVVFAVAPTEVEFWQGAKDRLHQRVRYTSQKDGQWRKDMLYP